LEEGADNDDIKRKCLIELGISRAIKCIKKRLVSKDGLVRNNLMGKRVNFSARTVITPDAKLKVGEMAIPPQIAEILTFPERVTEYNIKEVTKLVNDGKATCIKKQKDDGTTTTITLKYAMYKKGTQLLYGDYVAREGVEIKKNDDGVVVIPEVKGFQSSFIKITDCSVKLREGDRIIRNGRVLEDIRYTKKNNITLCVGDIVERHMQDGDMVLLNRQPTLHRGGMMAMEVKVIPGKTFRFNLSACASFNADFDIRS